MRDAIEPFPIIGRLRSGELTLSRHEVVNPSTLVGDLLIGARHIHRLGALAVSHTIFEGTDVGTQWETQLSVPMEESAFEATDVFERLSNDSALAFPVAARKLPFIRQLVGNRTHVLALSMSIAVFPSAPIGGAIVALEQARSMEEAVSKGPLILPKLRVIQCTISVVSAVEPGTSVEEPVRCGEYSISVENTIDKSS